ncbi:MAG TPA: transposase [Methanoculleus sp.]|nr:transposase [Methanoculleus sp.]
MNRRLGAGAQHEWHFYSLWQICKHRKAANTIERFIPGLMSYTAFPKEHAKRIRTTNMMERVNKELRRRTKVVGAFPNEESLLRLAGSILMEINEEWMTGRKYLMMEGECSNKRQDSEELQKI